MLSYDTFHMIFSQVGDGGGGRDEAVVAVAMLRRKKGRNPTTVGPDGFVRKSLYLRNFLNKMLLYTVFTAILT